MHTSELELSEYDRPTMPQLFDVDAERFFAAPLDLEDDDVSPGDLDDDELIAWWIAERRKAFAAWVTAIMAVCAALFVAGVLNT